MATKALQLINSVCDTKDLQVLMTDGADDLVVGYEDVWGYLKTYYTRYHSIPDIEVVQERFEDIEVIETKGASQYYMDDLRTEFVGNRIQQIMKKANDAIKNGTPGPEIAAKMQNSLNKLGRYSTNSRDVNIMDFDAAEKHYEEVRAHVEMMGGVPGIATGVSFIDSAYTSGFAPGDLIIVLGWTGRAKSLFTTLVACNAYKNSFRPLMVSLEMSAEKVRDRVYTILGSGLFSNSGLALGDINVDNFRTFKNTFEGRGDFNIISNDGVGELTPNLVQAKIDQYRPSVIVIDYAQLASDNNASSDMTTRMRNMSKEYKQLAERNKIPVILISSATPDSTASIQTPPTIEQVAWSKQLAYDADLSFAVHKHDDSDVVEIVCRKNRNGPLFAGYLEWDINNGIIQEKFDL